jgi:succinate dehydrogenase/fumarate reductase flavoprotein subunit
MSMTHYIAGDKQKPLENGAGEKTIEWLDKLRNANGSLPTSKIRLNTQRIMQNNAAVFRTQETLEEGIEHILSRVHHHHVFRISFICSELRDILRAIRSKNIISSKSHYSWLLI